MKVDRHLFFGSKNRFVVTVFVVYIAVIFFFAFWYQSLIADDAERQPNEIRNFIINPDIAAEKIRQNQFDLRTLSHVDSLNLVAVNRQLKVARQQVPFAWLATVTTIHDQQLYLIPPLRAQLAQVMSPDRWKSCYKRLLRTPKRGVELILHQPLSVGLTFEHTLEWDENDVLISEMSLIQGVNRLLLSKLTRRKDEDKDKDGIDRFMGAGDNVLARRFAQYSWSLVRPQLDIIKKENLPLGDRKWQLYQSLFQEEKQLRDHVAFNRRQLGQLVRPDWDFFDILFFTVVSLFANNYSDIYPNSTLARKLILWEFVIVWFLTICVISLDPETLWFMPKSQRQNQP